MTRSKFVTLLINSMLGGLLVGCLFHQILKLAKECIIFSHQYKIIIDTEKSETIIAQFCDVLMKKVLACNAFLSKDFESCGTTRPHGPPYAGPFGIPANFSVFP